MSTEPWHLDRIDQRSSVLDGMPYHPIGDGEGVNIYILDTGMCLLIYGSPKPDFCTLLHKTFYCLTYTHAERLFIYFFSTTHV